ncbi:unnamed protein product [Rhizopus stolonifer]
MITFANKIRTVDTYYGSFFDFLDFPDLLAMHEKQTVPSRSAFTPQPNKSISIGPLILLTTPSQFNTHSLNINPVTENTVSCSTEASRRRHGRSRKGSTAQDKDSSGPIGVTFKININDAPYEHPVFTEAEKMEGRKIFLFEAISRTTYSDGTTLTEASRRPCEHPMNSDIGKKERANPLAISCIWWQEKDQYFVTSCDIVRIVEGLIGISLNKQHKNRMRRQLQSYSPMTIGKKYDEEINTFYLQLIGFTTPSVKTIDKDIKIFRWEILEEALVKLVGQLKS